MTAYTCQTTFANGINPWSQYAPPETKPPTLYKTTRQDCLALLADGQPRSSLDVSNALDTKATTTSENLRNLWRDGHVQRELRQSAERGAQSRAFYMYWRVI